MPNMQAKLSGHNQKILNPEPQNDKKCNCRVKAECPLRGECVTGPVVYRATVTSNGQTETYTGLAGNNFKERHRNHLMDFKYSKNRNNTDLARHIWNLKDNHQAFEVKWDILTRAKTYDPSTKACLLCLNEKVHIMFSPQDATLNQRSEFFSYCKHKSKKLLQNV